MITGSNGQGHIGYHLRTIILPLFKGFLNYYLMVTNKQSNRQFILASLHAIISKEHCMANGQNFAERLQKKKLQSDIPYSVYVLDCIHRLIPSLNNHHNAIIMLIRKVRNQMRNLPVMIIPKTDFSVLLHLFVLPFCHMFSNFASVVTSIVSNTLPQLSNQPMAE